MQAWTSIHWRRERPANQKAHKDSAELRTNEEPIPSTSDFLFRGAFVTVPSAASPTKASANKEVERMGQQESCKWSGNVSK